MLASKVSLYHYSQRVYCIYGTYYLTNMKCANLFLQTILASGIVEKDLARTVTHKIAEMGLTEYADRSAATYSGGNKRKLSVAIAMIGEPSIVFLDEPSTGMDPVARRFMWQVPLKLPM